MNVFPWVAFAVGVAILAVAFLAARHEVGPNGFKAYAADLNSTNYKITVGVWLIIFTVLVSLFLMALHAVFPCVTANEKSCVGEVQIEFVWAIYSLCAALAAVGSLQFKWKRETQDPAITTANAAARAQADASPPAPPPNVKVETQTAKVEVEQPVPPQRTAPLPVTTLPIEARPLESALAPKVKPKLEIDA